MRLTCLVDNAVQTSAGFWGEHGLAYLVEAACQRIHFDTGQSGTVLAHNLKLFGIDPATINAVTISHAHYDHTGGLSPLLGQLRPGIPFFANVDLFRERFSQQDGAPKRTPALAPECSADASIGLPLNRAKPADRLDTKMVARLAGVVEAQKRVDLALDDPQGEVLDRGDVAVTFR
jgi:metal-dependent hydrolase (beta-lactamase superfamily II)